jgi:hypothetical protein
MGLTSWSVTFHRLIMIIFLVSPNCHFDHSHHKSVKSVSSFWSLIKLCFPFLTTQVCLEIPTLIRTYSTLLIIVCYSPRSNPVRTRFQSFILLPILFFDYFLLSKPVLSYSAGLPGMIIPLILIIIILLLNGLSHYRMSSLTIVFTFLFYPITCFTSLRYSLSCDWSTIRVLSVVRFCSPQAQLPFHTVVLHSYFMDSTMALSISLTNYGYPILRSSSSIVLWKHFGFMGSKMARSLLLSIYGYPILL